jgi:hypothetical protein
MYAHVSMYVCMNVNVSMYLLDFVHLERGRWTERD